MKGSALLLAGAFLLAGAAFAGTTANTAATHPATTMTNYQVDGTVRAVDASDKTIKVKGPWTEVTFLPAATVHVTGADTTESWNDLKVGEKVSVVYHVQGKSRIATQIAIHS
jgi:Cu/Ag efflux protein CusF